MRSIRSWFDAVLDQPLAMQRCWIEDNCPDATIRERLHELLAVNDQTDPLLLDRPFVGLLESIERNEAAPPEFVPGTRVGAFRLIEPLGSGGTATVFLAEREDVDFRQRVAVKLLRKGLHSDLQQALFRRERRTLAALSHPSIARLIDGGVTGAGVPYLVMDHVDGQPITAHAAERRLGVRDRLRMFCEVCDAVAVAHRQLIVHRDLKPSNILVDADGAPRLLDFGIAKLLHDTGSEEDMLPDALTPGYAAPEQYTGRPVSTATDVYALGVLLYELLLGERPDGSVSRSASVHALHAAAVRWSIPASRREMHSALRGDLDCILAKALAPAPEDRYRSAGALAEEVRRHLSDLPVEARPQTAAYRTSRFIVRHRGGVTVAVGLALGLFASLALALWQAGVASQEATRAREQAALARQETQRANAVRDLIIELFENESPGGARDTLPDTATLLQRGALKARTDLASTPALQAEMLIVIGRIYNELSRFDDARPLLQEAVAVARTLGAGDRRTLGLALSQRGQLAADQDLYEEALPDLDEASRILHGSQPGGLDLAVVRHRRALVMSEVGRHAEAIADHRAAIAIQQARLPADDPRLLRSYGALGTAFTRADRPGEAVAWQQRALELVRKRYGDNHVETARRLGNYGNSLMTAGRIVEAQAPMAQADATMRRIHRGAHADVAWMAHNHGSVLLALGRIDQADLLFRESIDINRAIGRDRSPAIGFNLTKLSRIQELRGDLAGASRLADQGVTVLAASLPPEHEVRLDAELRRVRLRLLLDPASDLATDTTRLQRSVDGAGSVKLSAAALHVRALAHAARGEDALAQPLLQRAVRMAAARPPSFPHDALDWFQALAELRRRAGDAAGAAAAERDAVAYADRWRIPARHPARRASRTILPPAG
ncbi:serine/threonine-protein kinase [Luteimonas saliphila]|uniref:serine/threonine-protein kinase n=1 Tax=Luteimonas saliphila TaxID=2804919 RepID=UPI00192D6EE0|nr:serine/threonine-protein kinase [Luteimonas saliphila]